MAYRSVEQFELLGADVATAIAGFTTGCYVPLGTTAIPDGVDLCISLLDREVEQRLQNGFMPLERAARKMRLAF